MANPVDNQAAGSDENFVGSREKAKNGYGQNGYQGPSSDLPGQATRMDRDYSLPADPSRDPGDWQTRVVPKYACPPAHGMKGPSEPAKVPDNNIRRPRVQAAPGTFQR